MKQTKHYKSIGNEKLQNKNTLEVNTHPLEMKHYKIQSVGNKKLQNTKNWNETLQHTLKYTWGEH